MGLSYLELQINKFPVDFEEFPLNKVRPWINSKVDILGIFMLRYSDTE